jgi:hypothetical protein
MTNQDFGRDQAASRNKKSSTTKAPTDVFAKASDAARDAGSKVKQGAADTASNMTDHVKDLLDQQISKGVDLAGHFASSVKLAADSLERESPALAGLVRNFGDKVEIYKDEFEYQTVDHFARTVSDFTRRQPALVFGLAALAGFFVFRTIKSASVTSTPSVQPVQDHNEVRRHGEGGRHG